MNQIPTGNESAADLPFRGSELLTEWGTCGGHGPALAGADRRTQAAPSSADDCLCKTEGVLEMEFCSQRLLAHIVRCFSSPGRFCSPHNTEKQTEVQNKLYISAPRELLPLIPRYFQAPRSQKQKKTYFIFQLSHSSAGLPAQKS